MHPLLAKFCRKFFVHFYDFYPTLDKAAELGLGSFTHEEKKMFARILDEITSQRYSDDDLLNLWNTSPADVHFRNGDAVRTLFRHVQQKIG